MSGREGGVCAVLVRAATAAVEPLYCTITAGRNWLFDRGLLQSFQLPRPVVSVGNITTGGTGKTPVVRWLAEHLRASGRNVAVLARGYGAARGELGDEQLMLDRMLNAEGIDGASPVSIVANPDRAASARHLLRERPDVDVFLLDDGFQHRRVRRDFDLVLVSAINPFGYERVLPRGMLREPAAGLRRANAFVFTHADQVTPAKLDAIERRIRRWNIAAPVYHAAHAHAGLRAGSESAPLPLDELRGKSWFAFCGIGDPQTFLRQLQSSGGRCAGHRWFPDHHRYTARDLAALRREAGAAGADVLVTTEKDWAKLAALPAPDEDGPPVWRVDMRIRFFGEGERLLAEQLAGVLKVPSA